jgi:hypothetical protein
MEPNFHSSTRRKETRQDDSVFDCLFCEGEKKGGMGVLLKILEE